ncbi:MAG: 50S ribosomal protein L4, partial [Patescibacteria group bacterium]
VNTDLLAQSVRTYLANQRKTTAKAKARSEVSRTTKKVYRQKGTGGARHGDRKAPIYVGGGKAHGPTGEQNFTLTMPKKMKVAALKSALSLKATEGKVVGVAGLGDIKTPKTKTVNTLLQSILTDKDFRKVALVLGPDMKIAVKASRNLAKATPYNVDTLTTYDVINSHTLVVSVEALEILTKRLVK